MDIIDHIAIKVNNLEQAEAWYLQHLKAEITFRDYKYIRLKVGNTNIALIDEQYYPYAHIGILVEDKKEVEEPGLAVLVVLAVSMTGL